MIQKRHPILFAYKLRQEQKLGWLKVARMLSSGARDLMASPPFLAVHERRSESQPS